MAKSQRDNHNGKRGAPKGVRKNIPIIDRIRRLTAAPDANGCHVWTGATRNGYANMTVSGAKVRVHRLMYEMATGAKIPAGMTIDHVCGVRRCVNPEHLECVSVAENNARYLSRVGLTARKASVTRCPCCGVLIADHP